MSLSQDRCLLRFDDRGLRAASPFIEHGAAEQRILVRFGAESLSGILRPSSRSSNVSRIADD